MSYDKSHIPSIANDVVNGRIDESAALSLFSEDLQRILRVEIGKRLRNRGYDRDNIGNTTDKGIPYLADDIVLGLVNEDRAFKNLFKGYHKQLTNEISKRREDEILWNQALASQTIEMFEQYLDTYNNHDSTYVGRYVSRAEEIIQYIESDDKEWIEAKRLDSEAAYLHYLDIYDNPAQSYRGKHIKEVKESIVRLKDDKDWESACTRNILQSYSDYLSMYDRVAPDYIGAHVSEARLAISQINDDADWSYSVNLNTVDSYKLYLVKYDVHSPAYRGKYVDDAKEAILSLTPPPAPDPRIKDDESWAKATKLNTLEAYQEYLRGYGHASTDGYTGAHIKEAEWAIRHIIDEDAWAKAKSINTVESYQEYKDICDSNNYPGYNWVHYNAASTHIGNLQKAEDVRLQKEADNTDWANSLRENTIEAYNRYLRLHNAGIHKKEAFEAIAKLEKQAFVNQENIDWGTAFKANTLSAYKSFVSKYNNPSLKYKSAHLDAAKQKIAELTPPTPVPYPIKWWRWIGIAVLLVLGWLTYVQWHDNAWPFNTHTNDASELISTIEEVDSLQWAIDNHNIPLLTHFAELDSIRAYYPLSLDLWSQNRDTIKSLKYIRAAIQTVTQKDSLYLRYISQLEIIKDALDYDGTIGHVIQPMPANIEERLPILVSERRISERATYISQKYEFPYAQNTTLTKYIEEDFNRWVNFAQKSTNIPSKIDAYNAALQLKEDSLIRKQLELITSKYIQYK